MAHPSGRPEPGRWAPLRSCPPWPSLLLAVLLALAAFGIALGHGFVWDDHMIVVPVPAYRDLDLAAIFFSKANGLEYLPVRDLTLALDAAVWGMNPFGFHLTNLVLYLLSLPLVYAVVRRLAGLDSARQPNRIAFFTTLVFALHPLHAEAVNFISARNNILAMLFLLLSLYLFIGERRSTVLSLALSVLAFLLAVLSKASAVFYPPFLVALLGLVPAVRPRRSALWLVLSAFLAVDAAGIAIHVNTAADTGISNRDVWRFGNESALWILVKAAQIPLFYFQKLLVPYPLSSIYPEDFLAGAYGVRAAAGVIAIVALLAWVWRLRRRSLLPLFGVLWLLLSLGPVLNIFPTSPVVADRYAYPAVFGFGLLCAYLVDGMLQNGKRAVLLVGVIPLFWIVIDWQRSTAWRSDLSLVETAYTLYPQWARSNYATTLFREGRAEEALAILAQEDPPTFRYPYMKGRLLVDRGRVTEAIPWFREALARGGDSERHVHLDLAKCYEQIGDPMSALDHYLKSKRAASLDALNRYQAAADKGIQRVRAQLAPRRAALEATAAQRSEDFRAQFEFALYLHALGDYEEAIRYYRRAAGIDPVPWETWYNLGLAYVKQDKLGRAITAFGAVLDRKPGHAATLNHLGIAHAALGDEAAALAYYQRALESDGGAVEAAFNIGRLYFRKGDRERSRKYLRRARVLAGDNRSLTMQIDYVLKQTQ